MLTSVLLSKLVLETGNWNDKFLTASLRTHHAALKQLTAERDALVATAAASLSTLHAARGRRADAAGLRDRLDDIQTYARVLRGENENGESFCYFVRVHRTSLLYLLDYCF